MKIVKFSAENIKKLKAVEITPSGNIVKITGKNGAGKSSVLDAIEMALVGKKAAGRGVLRKSTEKGKVVLDLGEFSITRSFTEGNNYLKIETKDGFERRSPQKFLDDIVGAISFDPMLFINADPKKQRQILLDFTGIELDKLDGDRRDRYDARTVESRYLKDAEARLRSLPFNEDAPETPVSIGDLMQELAAAEAVNDAISEMNGEFEETRGEVESFTADIKQLSEMLAIKKKLLEKAKAKLASIEERAKDPENSPIDLDPIREKIASAESINQMVRDNELRKEAEGNVKTHKVKVDKLTREIDDIDRMKTEAVEKSKLPVKGLSFTEDAVLFKGVELDNLATSEKIRVGLAISMALNPKLRVLRITDGSLLDSSTWKEIEKLVKDNDFQIWVEVVDESGKVGIYLEDGAVK